MSEETKSAVTSGDLEASLDKLKSAIDQRRGTQADRAVLCVWTYEVPGTAYPHRAEQRDKGFRLKMPRGARILCVQRNAQVGAAQISALVNTGMPEEERLFFVAETNYPLPAAEPEFESIEYASSWVAFGKIWHLFEVKRKGPREPGDE